MIANFVHVFNGSGQSGCGNTLLSGPNGVVTSPRYPFPYPHNMNCKYFIDVGRNSSVLLNFHLFTLERPDSPSHCKDWLTVSGRIIYCSYFECRLFRPTQV